MCFVHNNHCCSDLFAHYLSLLEEYKERFDFTVHVYVLMTNHVRFLIEVSDIPLSRIMQNLQFRYTRKFNNKYSKEGHLFQGRYKAMVEKKIRSDDSFAKLITKLEKQLARGRN